MAETGIGSVQFYNPAAKSGHNVKPPATEQAVLKLNEAISSLEAAIDEAVDRTRSVLSDVPEAPATPKGADAWPGSSVTVRSTMRACERICSLTERVRYWTARLEA